LMCTHTLIHTGTHTHAHALMGTHTHSYTQAHTLLHMLLWAHTHSFTQAHTHSVLSLSETSPPSDALSDHCHRTYIQFSEVKELVHYPSSLLLSSYHPPLT